MNASNDRRVNSQHWNVRRRIGVKLIALLPLLTTHASGLAQEQFDLDIDLARLSPEEGYAIFGDAERRHLGTTVDDIGDFNGDGFGDLLVIESVVDSAGVPHNGPAGELNNGFIVLGGGGAIQDIGSAVGRVIKIESTQAIGFNVSGLGDADGDGLADFAVGTSVPCLRLILGDEDALDSPVVSLEQWANVSVPTVGNACSPGERSSHAYGDFNGDGIADIVVRVVSGANAGTYLLPGSASLRDTDQLSLLAPPVILLSPPEQGIPGLVYTNVLGDLNRDGRDDLYFSKDSSPVEGDDLATIIFGGSDVGLGTARVPFANGAFGARLSQSTSANEVVLNIGDRRFVFNDISPGDEVGVEDGQALPLSFGPRKVVHLGDVAGVGTSGLAALRRSNFGIEALVSTTHENIARVRIFHSAPPTIPPALNRMDIAPAGDMDGDGIPDLLVGYPDYNREDGRIGTGAVYVVRGSALVAHRPVSSTYAVSARPAACAGPLQAGRDRGRAVGTVPNAGAYSSPDARAWVRLCSPNDDLEAATWNVELHRAAAEGAMPDGVRPASVHWRMPDVLPPGVLGVDEARFTFQYTAAEVAGLDAARLALYGRRDGSQQWIPLPTQRNARARLVATAIPAGAARIVEFALAEAPAPDPVEVDLSVRLETPASVIRGNAFAATARFDKAGAGSLPGFVALSWEAQGLAEARVSCQDAAIPSRCPAAEYNGASPWVFLLDMAGEEDGIALTFNAIALETDEVHLAATHVPDVDPPTDQDSTNNEVSVTIPVVAASDLATSLTVPAVANIGDRVTAVIRLENNGDSAATGAVHVQWPPGFGGVAVECVDQSTPSQCPVDPLVANSPLQFDLTLAAATSIDLLISGTVGEVDALVFKSSYSLDDSFGEDATPGDNSAISEVTVQPPELGVAFLGAPAGVLAGRPVAIDLAFMNSADSPGRGQLELRWDATLQNARVTCNALGASVCPVLPAQPASPLLLGGLVLAARDGLRFEISGQAADDVGGVVGASATYTPANELDADLGNNVAAAVVPIRGEPLLDLATTLDAPASANAGDTIAASVRLSNDGDESSTGRVQVRWPAGLEDGVVSCNDNAVPSQCPAAFGNVSPLVFDLTLAAGTKIFLTVTGSVGDVDAVAIDTAYVLNAADGLDAFPDNNVDDAVVAVQPAPPDVIFASGFEASP